MDLDEKSISFFSTAFSALVLVPIALFVVFLLAAGYRFGWIQQDQIGIVFAAAMLVILSIFLVLRANVKKVFLSKSKK